MKKVFNSAKGLTVGAMGLSLLPCVAISQQNDGFILEEVTVTARKIEENLQEIPISITSVSGESLEDRQIFSSDKLSQVTPNLQFTNNAPLAGNNASSQIFIRGIGQTDPTATVDPGVGIYIDDVYMGQSVGGTMAFRDIAQVQILRGPQGTLFGRNTIGGAIVLTTEEPGEEFGGKIRIGAGEDNLLDGFVALNTPFSDSVKGRFTFGTKKQDGYVTRVQTGEDLGDSNSFTTTGKIFFTPNDDLTFKFLYDYTEADENGNPLVFAASTETATFQRVASADAGCPGMEGGWNSVPAVPMIDDDRCANDFQFDGEFSNNGTYPLTSELENFGASFQVHYDINQSWSFKSISAIRSLDWVGIRDADNTPLTILHTAYDSQGDQTNQEFQLLFQEGSVNGVIGLYYFEEEVDDIVAVELNTPAPGPQGDSDNNETRNDNTAIFSQWTFSLSEALSLTVGGRYTEESKAHRPDQYNLASPDIKYLPVEWYERSFDAFTSNLAINWNVSDSAMLYASYSEGFKGGGWNSHFNTCQVPEAVEPCFESLPPATATPDRANSLAAQAIFPQVHSFDQEEAATWEVGIKSDLADDTLRFNAAIFTTDYTDLQFTYRAGVAPYLANAGEASITGFEIETTWIPASHWLIESGIGYLDTSIDSLEDIAGIATGVEVGNVLPYAPELQANLGLAYITTFSSGARLTPRLDWSYTSETFFDANNTVEIAQNDAVSVLNVSLSYYSADDTWKVVAGINNASDEIYPIAGNSSLGTGSGYAEIAYARPREAFISLIKDF